jgi:TonB family protein
VCERKGAEFADGTQMIRILRLASAAFLIACTTPAFPQDKNACPRPVTVPIAYPAEALRSNIIGRVVAEGRFDECGRILEVQIQKSSGSKVLDKAVVDALKQSVLSEYQRSATKKAGWYEISTDFLTDSTPAFKKVDWPKSHKKPMYVSDMEPIGYVSIVEAQQKIKDSYPDAIRPPVVEYLHRFSQVNTPSGVEFWLFIFERQGPPVIAARYRTVFVDELPVVKLAFACEIRADVCVKIKEELMKGLPFAKARK